ncbi:MAG TPA: cardiolipin synthase [Alphaproteobacteria bacterium]|jgi:cardiolipin synthase
MLHETFPTLGTIYLVCEWIVRLVMMVLVPLRRAPEATRSWLLLIFFLPLPGLGLYLMIGRSRFPKWRMSRFQELVPFLASMTERLVALAPDGAAAHGPIPSLVRKLGRLPAVGGNGVEFLAEYDNGIDRLVADIDQAKLHVRLLVYIFADDATGRKVIDALGRAVARGVSCHVLIDSVGSFHWLRSTMQLLREAGVEVREALPPRLWHRRTRRDMRNHRKLFLIDGGIGYAGSQNIVDKDFKPGIVNRELVLRVTGPVAAEMTAVFLADWYLETETMLAPVVDIPEPAGTATVQVLPSGANYPLEGFETLLIWQIHEARDRIVIVTPYLIPDEGLLNAMRTAALRGVKIDLIVSAVVDQRLVSLAQRSYYEDLLRAGIRIHRFQHYLLHAKNVSIDGKLAVVGSSNVDVRSFQLNEEVSLLLLDEAAVARLESFQRGYLAHSDTIDFEAWCARPRLQKIGENLARLVSPLL